MSEYYTAYLEHTLPEAFRQEVEAHLQACPRCTAELADHTVLIEHLHALPARPVPAGFVGDVRAKLDPRPQPRPFFWRVPLVAGGLAAALLLAFLIMHPPTGQQTTLTRTPPTTPPPKEVDVAQAPSTPPEGGVAIAPTLTPDAGMDPFNLHEVTPDTNPPTPPDTGSGAGRTPRAGRVGNPGGGAEGDSSSSTIALAPSGTYGSRGPSGPVGPEGPVGPTAPGGVTGPTPSVPPMTMETTSPLKTNVTRRPDGSLIFYQGPRSPNEVNAAYTLMPDTVDAGANCALQLASASVAVQPLEGAAPVADEGRIAVRLLHSKEGMLTSRAVVPAQSDADKYPLTADAAAEVRVPFRKDGSALQLTLQVGEGHERWYLIAPGAGAPEATISLQVQEQPLYRSLTRLATAAGVYVAVPASFAETSIAYMVKNLPPITALSALASEHHARLCVQDGVAYVIPETQKGIAGPAPK